MIRRPPRSTLFPLHDALPILQDLGRRLLEAALAGAAEVVRCIVETEQRAGLLGQRGLVREIVACKVGRSEERRVGKGVDLGGRRIIKKKKKKTALDLGYWTQ